MEEGGEGVGDQVLEATLRTRSEEEFIVIRAHNLCHDNRQLIVIAINLNRSAIKINCN